MRRNMANELLLGRAACYMINRYAKVDRRVKRKCRRPKKLQKILINHLYQLKLNKFKLPYMELEDESRVDSKQGQSSAGGESAAPGQKRKWRGKTQKVALKKAKKG